MQKNGNVTFYFKKKNPLDSSLQPIKKKVVKKKVTKEFVLIMATLDSGIDIAPGINVAHGTFGKNIKHSP